MAIVNRKYNIVYIFWLYAMLFSMFPLVTVAQTDNIPDDNAAQNALLSFSIDETPVHVRQYVYVESECRKRHRFGRMAM